MHAAAPHLVIADGDLDPRRLARDVDRLAGDTPVPLAVRPEAVVAWLHHRPHLEPLVVRVVREAEVVGLVVLAARHRAGLVQVVKAGATGEPWDVLVPRPSDVDPLVSAVATTLERFHRPWTLRLADLPGGSRFAASLVARLRHAELVDGPSSPRLDVSSELAWSAVATRNTRSQLAKARNRIAHDGHALTLEWLTDDAAIAGHLDDVIAIRAARNAQRRSAPGSDPVEVATFASTVHAHARAGRARVLLARVDGVTAAFAVCFVSGDVLWVYANAVSPAHLRYSAGAIANGEVMRAAHADPALRSVDWGPGLQRYKVSGPVTVTPSTVVEAWSAPWVRFARRAARITFRA